MASIKGSTTIVFSYKKVHCSIWRKVSHNIYQCWTATGSKMEFWPHCVFGFDTHRRTCDPDDNRGRNLTHFGLESLLDFLLVKRDLLFVLPPQVLVGHTSTQSPPAWCLHITLHPRSLFPQQWFPSASHEGKLAVGYLQGLCQFELVVLPDTGVHLHYPLLLLAPRLSHLLQK